MPPYKTLTLPPALYPGDSYLAFNNENPVANTMSERVALAESSGPTGIPKKISVEVVFSAAPTAGFQIQVMEADTDISTDYVANAQSIQAVDANNVARLELATIVAQFVALQVGATAPGVSFTAKITR